MKHVVLKAVVALGTLYTATTAQAQDSVAISVQAGLGVGHGRGGNLYVSRGELVLDAMIGARVRPVPAGAVFAGLAWAWQGSFGDDVCHLVAGGGCALDLPSYTSLAAVGGWELGRRRGASLRLLAGPALYVGGERRSGGAQARVEAATPAPFHLAAFAAARGDVILRPHTTHTLGAITIGVRIE